MKIKGCVTYSFLFSFHFHCSQREMNYLHIFLWEIHQKKKYKSVTKMLTDDSIQIIPIKIKYAHHHMVLRSNF